MGNLIFTERQALREREGRQRERCTTGSFIVEITHLYAQCLPDLSSFPSSSRFLPPLLLPPTLPTPKVLSPFPPLRFFHYPLHPSLSSSFIPFPLCINHPFSFFSKLSYTSSLSHSFRSFPFPSFPFPIHLFPFIFSSFRPKPCHLPILSLSLSVI